MEFASGKSNPSAGNRGMPSGHLPRNQTKHSTRYIRMTTILAINLFMMLLSYFVTVTVG